MKELLLESAELGCLWIWNYFPSFKSFNGEPSTQFDATCSLIRTGAEHSIWQARQKRCAPALGLTCVWSMWILNALQLFIIFLSVSASFTHMVAIWVECRGEIRFGCSFSSHLSLASSIREMCVHYKNSYGSKLGPAHLDLNLWGQWLVLTHPASAWQLQVHSDLDNLQAPVSWVVFGTLGTCFTTWTMVIWYHFWGDPVTWRVGIQDILVFP